MSDIGVGGLGGGAHRTRTRARPRRGGGCLAVMVAVAIVVALGGFAYVKGVELIRDAVAGPEDYSGDGQRPLVAVSVQRGDSGTDIADTLLAAGVVKSAEAFVEVAKSDARASTIQAGQYRLMSRMSAGSALAALLDPDSLVSTPTVTIPEGLRAEEILDRIVQQTDFSAQEVKAAYDDTAALGLPGYAKGDPEGYLYPSTYDVEPTTTARGLLRQMVARFKQVADRVKLTDKAAKLGYGPHDVVTVASLVQAEAGAAGMGKVASVVYNRLDEPLALQFDSTLHYAVDSRGEVVADDDLRAIDSPYNSYRRNGLPPTPIDSPGEEALVAALEPADTDFLYFVTVNLKTGETRFASSYGEHRRNVDVYREYCETSDEC